MIRNNDTRISNSRRLHICIENVRYAMIRVFEQTQVVGYLPVYFYSMKRNSRWHSFIVEYDYPR